ncbi:MAG: ABC transporter ATP-binding protein [SAR202 cluster bacterium]|nr:ABC transporter ATP-binding protein [SAR202 cluster bacterium]
MQTLSRIIKLTVSGNKTLLISTYIATFISGIALLLQPYLIGLVIDQVVESLNRGESVHVNQILQSTSLIFITGLIRGIAVYCQSYLSEKLAQKLAYTMRNKFYDHVQHMDFKFHDEFHTGNLMSRAITDVEAMRMFVIGAMIRGPYFILLFSVVSIILLYNDLLLGIIAMSFMPVIGIMSSYTRLKLSSIWKIVQEQLAHLSVILQENLTGMKVVKSFNAQQHEVKKFDLESFYISKSMIRATKIQTRNSSALEFLYILSTGLVVVIGAYKIIEGDLTAGQLAQFVFYLGVLAIPVRWIGMLVNNIARTVSAGTRLFDVLDKKSEVQELKSPIILKKPQGEITFKNVTFGYTETKQAIKNISFKIEPGETVAFLGSPGSGKSTIAQLIPRFYEIKEGQIQIDGLDIKSLSLKSLRNNIGIVRQSPTLFPVSISENIAYQDIDSNQSEIEKAAKIAQIHNYIKTLPNAYQTIVNEDGSNLSGGQKQRIMIARTILHNPAILLLDDSTSSVDATTEENIINAMKKVMENRTSIIITHRLNTIKNADRLIIFHEGEIAEEGTHNKLIKSNGLYKEIYNLQMIADEKNKDIIESLQ